MHCCLPARFVRPLECSMCKVDKDTACQKIAPEDSYLLALADCVGGNKCGLDGWVGFHAVHGLALPSSAVVETYETSILAPDTLHVRQLLGVSPLMSANKIGRASGRERV